MTGGTGTVSVRNGGEIEASEILISYNGSLGENGTIRGNVTNNGGATAAGNSPGTLNIVGGYTQNDGFLEVEIALPKTNDIVNFLFADGDPGLKQLVRRAAIRGSQRCD